MTDLLLHSTTLNLGYSLFQYETMKSKHHLLFLIYFPGHIIGYISEPVSAALSVFELPSTLAPTLDIHYPLPALSSL